LKAKEGDELHAETETAARKNCTGMKRSGRAVRLSLHRWFALSKHLMRYAAQPE